MATIVDLIYKYLLEEIQKNNEVEFKRNHLAERFKCVPSQINYILDTKFKKSEHYVVEIVRGSGGYVKIKKVTIWEQPEEKQWSKLECKLIIEKAYHSGKITPREAMFMISTIEEIHSIEEWNRVMKIWLKIIKGE